MGISSILGTRSLHPPQVGIYEVNYKMLDMSCLEFGVGKYFSANSLIILRILNSKSVIPVSVWWKICT